MSSRERLLLLVLTAAALGCLVLFAPPKEDSLASAPTTSNSVSKALVTSVQGRDDMHVLPLRDRQDFATDGDAFHVEEKVTEAIPAKAPPIDVPAIPYVVLGKEKKDGVWEVFLARGDETFVVHENMSLETEYRIGRIAPPDMEVTYAPLNVKSTMSIGEGE